MTEEILTSGIVGFALGFSPTALAATWLYSRLEKRYKSQQIDTERKSAEERLKQISDGVVSRALNLAAGHQGINPANSCQQQPDPAIERRK